MLCLISLHIVVAQNSRLGLLFSSKNYHISDTKLEYMVPKEPLLKLVGFVQLLEQ